MKICVAACSMIALAMRLSSASCALCVAKPTMPLRLRIVFSQSLIRRTKTSSSSAFQPSSTTMIAAAAVEPLLDAVEQVHHRRRAQRRIVEDRGHVEADDCGGQVDAVASLSNSQARSPSPHQGSRRDQRSPALGPAAAAEQFGKMAQPADARPAARNWRRPRP